MQKIIFPKVNLTGVAGVLIDVDDTLYPYKDANDKALKLCYKHFVKNSFISYSYKEFRSHYFAKRREVTKRLKPGGSCRSRLFAFNKLFEELGIKRAYNKALEYEKLYWKALTENIKVSSEALKFLKLCKNKYIRVCAITDMQAHFQIEKLQKLGVDKYIDYIVTSEEAGVEKPSEIIFELALKKLNVKRDSIIMVGNSIEKDINGAHTVGIRAFKADVVSV